MATRTKTLASTNPQPTSTKPSAKMKRGPFLFPRPNPNFSAGRYMPPSKNTGAQPTMFQRSDPYARNMPQTARQALAATPGVPAYGVSQVAALAGQPMAAYGAQPAPAAPAAPPVAPAGTPAVGGNPLANAAQLFGGSVAGNPFIAQGGQQRLQQGLLPDLNQINPAFWRYTSPVIQQALQGLYRSAGVRPEELEFTAQQWRPMGL